MIATVKTIISIVEVVLFNLLPAPVAAPVVNMIKDAIPMLGIILIRLGLNISLEVQKVQNSMSQKIHQAKLFRLENIVRIDFNKKLRA